MAIRYRFFAGYSNFNSDLTPAAGWNKILDAGMTDPAFGPVPDYLVPNGSTDVLAGSWSSQDPAVTPNPPLSAQWPAGNYTASVRVVTAPAGLTYKLAIVRVNQAGVVQETLGTSVALNGVGVKNFTVAAAPAAGATTDRAQIRVLASNHSGGGLLLQLANGSDSQYLEGPWAFTYAMAQNEPAVHFVGPFQVAGSYFHVWGLGANLFAFASADPPLTQSPADLAAWTLSDAIQISSGTGPCAVQRVGDVLHIAFFLEHDELAAGSGQALYYTTLAAGAFSVPELVHDFLTPDLTTGSFVRCPTIAVRSGDIVFGCEVQATAFPQPVTYEVDYVRRTAPNVYTGLTKVNTTANARLVGTVLGAADLVHFHYINPTTSELYHRSLDGASALDGELLLDSGFYLNVPVAASNGLVLASGQIMFADVTLFNGGNHAQRIEYPDTPNPAPVTLGPIMGQVWPAQQIAVVQDPVTLREHALLLNDIGGIGIVHVSGPLWTDDAIVAGSPTGDYSVTEYEFASAPQVYDHHGKHVAWMYCPDFPSMFGILPVVYYEFAPPSEAHGGAQRLLLGHPAHGGTQAALIAGGPRQYVTR